MKACGRTFKQILPITIMKCNGVNSTIKPLLHPYFIEYANDISVKNLPPSS
jgi:hypothetical protein